MKESEGVDQHAQFDGLVQGGLFTFEAAPVGALPPGRNELAQRERKGLVQCDRSLERSDRFVVSTHLGKDLRQREMVLWIRRCKLDGALVVLMRFVKLTELPERTASVCERRARRRDRNGAIKFGDGAVELLPCNQDRSAIEMRIGEVRRQGNHFRKPGERIVCLVQCTQHVGIVEENVGIAGIDAGSLLQQWLGVRKIAALGVQQPQHMERDGMRSAPPQDRRVGPFRVRQITRTVRRNCLVQNSGRME
ncbi:hypothetical protein NLM27_10510 [Bradyrhizobium sp. CCGB12]|nr:hypothetical protein [Bradyrhizobium sp. CCGB12]MCP3389207.1 hypothetical protein [Bradyrhizobium sp. CCGB12]